MTDTTNPLLAGYGLPRFDEILPQHIGPAIDHVLDEASETLSRLEALTEPPGAFLYPESS
jgi:oligopeptidase A